MWDRRGCEWNLFVWKNVLLLALSACRRSLWLSVCSVCGPNSDHVRRFLWELAGLVNWWNLPWCIGGDFNEILFLNERYSEANFNPSMSEFSYFIFEQNLVHLPLAGGRFTLSNNQDTLSWSRIDRLLISSDWKVQFPKDWEVEFAIKKTRWF